MSPTDTDALTERIAEKMRESLTHEYGAGSDLEASGVSHDGTVWQTGGVIDVPQLAEEVAPIVAVEVRKAKAGALREAADGLLENIDWSDGRSSYGDNDGYEASARELRALATEYETGDQ